MKIALDIDGVCLDFESAFIEECKNRNIHIEKKCFWNFFDNNKEAKQLFNDGLDKSFWLNLNRVKESLDINFEPVAYISHRNFNPWITKDSLIKNGFPEAPVYHVKYTEDKVKIFKDIGAELFIDDRASTVLYFLENGLASCLLKKCYNENYNLPFIKELRELNNGNR